MVNCIFCKTDMDFESHTKSENDESLVTYVCPMCDTVAVFCNYEDYSSDDEVVH